MLGNAMFNFKKQKQLKKTKQQISCSAFLCKKTI